MVKGLRRRDFLGLSAAGLGFPILARASDPDLPAPSSLASGEDPHGSLWDYQSKSVKVRNPGLEESWNTGSHFAFDGFGGSRYPNSIAHGWFQAGSPSPEKRFFCTIDYGDPVTITKFVHYFYIPAVKDYRIDPLVLSTAFASLNIYRGDDGANWELAEEMKGVPPDWPQVLTLSQPKPARHYKIEITGLVPGAPGIRTYEIESFTGPALHNPAADSSDLKSGETCRIRGRVVGTSDPAMYNVAMEPSKDLRPVGGPARVDSTGAFSLTLTPLRSGDVPAVLHLRDTQGTIVERRSVMLAVAPRVIVRSAKAGAESISVDLLNTGTHAASVRLGWGQQWLLAGQLDAGKASEFRLAKDTKRSGTQVVELRVEEDGQLTSQWVLPVEHDPAPQEGHLHNPRVDVFWSVKGGKVQLHLNPGTGQQAIRATLEASFDDSPVSFLASAEKDDASTLWGRHRQGSIECTLRLVGSALRATFRNLNDGLQREKTSGVLAVRLKPEHVTFRFMPAYVYSKEPISYFEGVYGKQPLVLGGWFPPTRMVALATSEGTVGLVPDRDRCLLGIEQNDAVTKIRLGTEPVELLIPVVTGDWFECFRYVVTDVYKFDAPRQYRPLIESVSGEAKYLAHNEDVWSRKMQVVTSFPKQDYVYAFYGLTYTVPALYAWYQMTGDEQALERARKCVHWLLDYPGVRIKEGPATGAFFSQYVSPDLKTFELGSLSMPANGVGGCDQANNRWLEPHATGAAAWTLLHYYMADGERDRGALEAAKTALDWLLKTQNPSGGWFYAYQPDGSKLTEEEDAGNIWNIWALYRYGKLSGEAQYLEAADKAKNWFASKFLARHICRGYWEDVSGANGHVGLSWEAYEFGIAANVFAEMGDKELAVESARNAVTWIWTRVVDCRDYSNSYGHAHEQWNWPPATYVAPMFGLAAQTAFRLTGDDLFRRFAGAAKTIGWWIVRDNGGTVWPRKAAWTDIGGAFWPLEGTEFVPLEEPFDVTLWVDWISAQQCTICLRWLIQEINMRSAGKVAVNADTLAGAILEKSGKVALWPDEIKVTPQSGQINWLGYQTEDSRVLAILNHDAATSAAITLPALRSPAPRLLISTRQGEWREETASAVSELEIPLPAGSCVLVVWPLRA